MAVKSVFDLLRSEKIFSASWQPVEGSQVAFTESDIALIDRCYVYKAEGDSGIFFGLTVTAPSKQMQFSGILDRASSKLHGIHLMDVDPSRVVVYQLRNTMTGEEITRIHIK